MKKFKVHIFAVVRVPVEVEAETPLEAARKADDTTPLHEILSVGSCEFAEQVLDFIVDEFDEEGKLKDSVHFKYKDIYQ